MYWDRFYEIVDVHKVVRVVGVGLEQTGKTNTSFFFAHLFNELAYRRGSIPIIFYIVWRGPIITLQKIKLFRRIVKAWRKEDECNDYRPDSMYLIIDDMSFTSLTYDKYMRIFLNYMSKIKHKFPFMRRIVTHYIVHYSKATLPFLRIGHIRYVSSIASPQEVSGLSEYFNEGTLWNFYNVKIQHLRRTRFLQLFNLYGVEFMSKPPLVRPPDNMISIPNKYILKDKEQGQVGIYKVEIPQDNAQIPFILIKKRKDYTDIYLDVEKFKKLANNGLTKKYIRLIKLMNP